MDAARYPDERPAPDAFTNQRVLTEARDFFEWAKVLDNRGAPHRV